MHMFTQSLPDYPELRFVITVTLPDRRGPRCYVRLQAEGQRELRERWRNDFKRWCAERQLEPTSRKGNARIFGTSEFELFIERWDTIAEFMVRWLGLEWLAGAAYGASGLQQQLGQQLERLSRQVSDMKATLDLVHTRTINTDCRVAAAGHALIRQEA